MRGLKDKVVIVVGSTSGLGKAMAERFGEEGSKVIVTGRREDVGEEVVKELEGKGYTAKYYKLDVTDEKQADSLMEKVNEDFGRIDVLINNAGIADIQPLETTPTEDWMRVIDTNLNSVFYLTRAAIPYLKESKGNIIITSSISGIVGGINQPAYAASKAGVAHFAKATAVDLGKYGIRVNAISPGVMETEILKVLPKEQYDALASIIPLGHTGMPEDIAAAAAFLASDDAKYISGHNLVVDAATSVKSAI